jgi:TRAP-type mannitol/chloroaromatic compound transport system permease small subunit
LLVKFHRFLGNLTALLLILLILNVFIDVILRYFFHTGSIAMQEMEWHLFSVMFLFGMSYALNEESHVSVDFLYVKLSVRKRALINIVGTLIMLIPFSFLIVYVSYDFVMDSYQFNEVSQDPGGLTHRWIIKFMIPLSFLFLIISAILYINRNLKRIRDNKW